MRARSHAAAHQPELRDEEKRRIYIATNKTRKTRTGKELSSEEWELTILLIALFFPFRIFPFRVFRVRSWPFLFSPPRTAQRLRAPARDGAAAATAHRPGRRDPARRSSARCNAERSVPAPRRYRASS